MINLQALLINASLSRLALRFIFIFLLHAMYTNGKVLQATIGYLTQTF